MIATQVLRTQDDPGQMLVMVEYRDQVARTAVQAMVAADRPPIPLLHSRVHRWSRGRLRERRLVK